MWLRGGGNTIAACVVVSCSVLQYDAVRCSALQCVAVCGCGEGAMRWQRVLQSVVVRCSALQCIAVRCSVCPCGGGNPIVAMHTWHTHVSCLYD